MKGKRRYFFIGLAILLSISTFAQKAKYQSNIIFRLSQYVTWPEKNQEHKFIIGVVGNTTDFKSFQQLAISKVRFHNNPIEVRYLECTDTIEECHLLYVSEECKIEMTEIVRKTENEPILIVSGHTGYGKMGSIINFIDCDGKLKFEFNQDQAAKRGLDVSAKLKNLAIVI